MNVLGPDLLEEAVETLRAELAEEPAADPGDAG
jgi:hypothetical protein